MQCEAVTRLVKQGALGGGGGREGGREGGGGVEELERLLRGMCGVRLVVEEEEEEEEEMEEEEEGEEEGEEDRSSGNRVRKRRRRTGGREGKKTRTRRRRKPTCEWTDLTLPLLTAIVAQRPTLSEETVLMLLERMLGALEVRRREGREEGREGGREGGTWPAGRKERGKGRDEKEGCVVMYQRIYKL